jgi:polysaccharide chain length determinant protein (PEP-CTERM system associated)
MPEEEELESDLGETLKRSINLLIRRRWLIAGTAVAVALGTIALSFHLPNRYTSEATIFAVQQRVPERYVVPTATADPSQALEAMVQEVLSRPRLLAVIDEFGLLAEERKRLQPEQLFKLIRRDLKIEPLERMLGRGDVNAFKISFVADTPQLAQVVTQRLTTLFIEQNLKARADQATTTTEFLREQLKISRQDLDQQEQRLRDFKMQYLGELPEQQQGNLGILSSLQSQLDNVMASRNQAQQQRLYLESLLGEYERRGSRSAPVRSANGEILTPLQAAESDLLRLRAEEKNLLTVYTPNHPDVVRKQSEIAAQQIFLENLRSAKPGVEANGVPRDGSATSEPDIGSAQLRSQLRANKLEIDNLIAKEQKLRADVDLYQSRLNLTPVREQQLTSIQRDYDLLKLHYGELLKKEQESQLATDLEKRQEGQQFRLAEPPHLPTMPSSPKRFRISLMGLIGGLVAGCALAFLLNFRDSSFYSEDDAMRRLELPIAIGIPLLLTPAEKRNRSRWRVLEYSAASVLFTVVAFAEIYVYRHG